MKKLNVSFVANSYFWSTVICLSLLLLSFSSYYYWYWTFFLIFALGCHTTVYPFVAFLLGAETGYPWLAIAILAFWGCYMIAFVGSYLWAVWAKSYLPIAIVALIDSVFSAVITVIGIINAGFQSAHMLFIIGALLSLAVTLILFRGVADSKKSKEEILRN